MGDPTYSFDNNDPVMTKAQQRARATFKYFWRELSWEKRRIIPGLGVAAVKLPFRTEVKSRGVPSAEHMWVSEVDFDGVSLTGRLLNSPNWIKSMKAGSGVKVSVNQLEDWLYAIHGIAYGGFTVNVMRGAMSGGERRSHDKAWGLDFGDPSQVRIVPNPEEMQRPGFFARILGKKSAPPIDPTTQPFFEHPMSVNMLPKVEEALQENRSMISDVDDQGRTMLHIEALAGNLGPVKLLLKYGADPKAKTRAGHTALQLATSMRWAPIVEVLEAAEK